MSARLLCLVGLLLLGAGAPSIDRVPEGELTDWLAAGERIWIHSCLDNRGPGLHAGLYLVPDPREEARGADPTCPDRKVLLWVADCSEALAAAAYRLPPRCAMDVDWEYDWDRGWQTQSSEIPYGSHHPVPTGPARIALRHFEKAESGYVRVREVYDVGLEHAERVQVEREALPGADRPRPWIPWRPVEADLGRIESTLLALRRGWREARNDHPIYQERWRRLDAVLRAASCERWGSFTARYRADSLLEAWGWPPIEESQAEREIRIVNFVTDSGSGSPAASPIRIVARGDQVEGELFLFDFALLEHVAWKNPPGVEWRDILGRLEANGIWELPPFSAWGPEAASARARDCEQVGRRGWLLERRRGGRSERLWYGPVWSPREGDPRGPDALPLQGALWPIPRGVLNALRRATREGPDAAE